MGRSRCAVGVYTLCGNPAAFSCNFYADNPDDPQKMADFIRKEGNGLEFDEILIYDGGERAKLRHHWRRGEHFEHLPLAEFVRRGKDGYQPS